MSAACEEGYDPEEAKEKLQSLLEKFGKGSDEDLDFDDLNIEDDFSSDEEEEDSWSRADYLHFIDYIL